MSRSWLQIRPYFFQNVWGTWKFEYRNSNNPEISFLSQYTLYYVQLLIIYLHIPWFQKASSGKKGPTFQDAKSPISFISVFCRINSCNNFINEVIISLMVLLNTIPKLRAQRCDRAVIISFLALLKSVNFWVRAFW